MVNILFICHGNICRSPMAEFIMKKIVKEAGKEDEFYIESAATSTEELYNPVYPPARDILNAHGISCKGKTARQLEKRDYDKFDYLIAMDNWNIRNIGRIIKDDPEKKISLLLDYTDTPGEIDDPWYSHNFEMVYNQIVKGCEGLYKKLIEVK